MNRLYFVVEGQTDVAFVKEVISPFLASNGHQAIAWRVGKATGSASGGGRYKNWRRDIVTSLHHCKAEGSRVTTLFDLYGLPSDFPGWKAPTPGENSYERCSRLEAALYADIEGGTGKETFRDRFIPYIQRHEFEALVFAALDELADIIDEPAEVHALKSSVAGTPPEEINEGAETAPSKRLKQYITGYNKVLHSSLALHDIGLDAIRACCPRFDAWIGKLLGDVNR